MGSKDRLACVNKILFLQTLPARDFTYICEAHSLLACGVQLEAVGVFHLSLFWYGHQDTSKN